MEFMKINEIILLIKYTSGVVKMYSFHWKVVKLARWQEQMEVLLEIQVSW